MGLTTVPEALRAASRIGRDAVAEVRAADCGSPVEKVAAALPGARAAGAAASFANTWKSTFTAWCDDADRHAAGLETAADTYVAGDDHARSALPGEGKQKGPR